MRWWSQKDADSLYYAMPENVRFHVSKLLSQKLLWSAFGIVNHVKTTVLLTVFLIDPLHNTVISVTNYNSSSQILLKSFAYMQLFLQYPWLAQQKSSC